MKKTLIISGGTKGLGRAVSQRFGSAGFEIIALFGKDATAAREFETEMKNSGVRASCFQGTTFLIPDGHEITLINNATAPFEPKPFHLWKESELQSQWETAVLLSYQLCQKVLPVMVKQKKGTIVNVLTSEMGNETPKGFSAYSIAKHGLLGLTKAVHSEYERLGIRCLSICPPFMQTPLTNQWNSFIRNAVQKASAEASVGSVADYIFEKCHEEKSDKPEFNLQISMAKRNRSSLP